MTRFVLPGAALAALLIPQAGAAQQPRDTVRLAPLVVTATRVPTRRDDVANAVTVLSGAELERRGVASVAEALRSVPGLTIVQSGPTGSVTSLFVRGGESDYVRVLIDGVPANQPGGAINLADLTVDNVERIEIVRGPASALYGSDAVSGVVQIFTRRAAAGRAAASVLATDRGSVVRGAYAVQARGGALTLGASRTAAPGVYRLNHHYRGWTASSALRAERGGNDLLLSLRHQDGVFSYPTAFDGTPSDPNQFTAGRLTAASLDAGRAVSRRIEVRALLGYASGVDRAENPADSAGDPFAYAVRTTYGRRSADLRLNYRTPARGIVSVGGTLEHQDFRSNGDTARLSRGNRALYAQLVGPLGTSAVVLTLGGRLEDNEHFGGFGTWRAGLAARVNARTVVRASAGTSFKEPTFFEQYGGGFSTGNRSLAPERSLSGEVGLEAQLAAAARLTLTAFAQRFDSLIQYRYFVPAPGASNYTNLAGAEARGLEVELAAAPWRGGAVAASWTWLRTIATDSGADGMMLAEGRPLIRRPEHSGSLRVSQSLAAVNAGVTALYVGRREDVDYSAFERTTLRPYLRLDLDVAVAVGRGVSALLRVDNATDARYQEAFGFPARGVTAWFGLGLR